MLLCCGISPDQRPQVVLLLKYILLGSYSTVQHIQLQIQTDQTGPAINYYRIHPIEDSERLYCANWHLTGIVLIAGSTADSQRTLSPSTKIPESAVHPMSALVSEDVNQKPNIRYQCRIKKDNLISKQIVC